uniref:Inorganic pyrophosphatase n=1 Tax=Plectus sambesii TaxID=2011161 RepID=A0A914W942_9BILA
MLATSRVRLITAAVASTSAASLSPPLQRPSAAPISTARVLPNSSMFRQVRQASASSTMSTTMTSATTAPSKYTIEERGALFSPDYRCYFKGPEGYISPWHDIPMYADPAKKTFNMFVEIARWNNAKMEVGVKEPLNPIKQDIKKGVPRFVDHCFPHHGYIWNYGAIPQTWEDPAHIDSDTNAKGDNDPIDVCEIGSKIHTRGSVLEVKILGALAMVDEGETDWKLIAIDVTDPLADKLNDIDDVEKYMPGLLRATVEWFRIYKIPAGKPPNQFAFNGQFKNREYALRVIAETNEFWKILMKKTDSDYALKCCSVEASDHFTEQSVLAEIVAASAKPAPPLPIPASADVWHYVSE